MIGCCCRCRCHLTGLPGQLEKQRFVVWVCEVLAWPVRVLMIVLARRRRMGSVAIGCWKSRRRAVAGRDRLRDGESGRLFYVRVLQGGRTGLRLYVLTGVHSLLCSGW